ncbi:MAG: GGDEF domain-containing protein [Pleomorphochaeta sp.]
MLCELFIIAGIIILLVCIYLFAEFRKEEREEFGIVSKKINVINNAFHILIAFFVIGYLSILSLLYSFESNYSFVLLISQILFWGAVFVLLTIFMLKIMLENVIKTKLNQIDHLTLLNTKMAGNCKIDELLLYSKSPVYLAILDLDNFKKLNDIYGHIIGDEVLIEVAKIIKHHINEDDIACRFGGDEFVIGFINSDEKSVVRALELIKDDIYYYASQFTQANMSVSVGLTFGVGIGAGGKNTYKQMMLNADKALYHVKKNGKNSIHVYSKETSH